MGKIQVFPQKSSSFLQWVSKMKENSKKANTKRAVCALSAGILNGLLGTGGGVPLYFLLSREGAGRGAYATASVGVLLLSLSTVFLYRGGAVSLSRVTPFLPFLAVLGGTLGALLLGKINTRALRFAFSLLLLFSGLYLLGKECYLALYQ